MLNEEELESRLGLYGRSRPLVLPFLLWAGIIVSVIVICLMLPGCATKEGPRNEVCMFRLIGNTEDGMPVVATTCVSPEAFAESQK